MSELKVNKISPRSGTAFTLGDSGDTFTIPSGATINNQGTAVNFGATGSASWVTTVKTSTFTAVAGEGYFVNTTGGAVTVNLPAGVAGAVVAIKDYANTFDTNAVTLVQNGSDKIGGSAVNATLDTEGIAVTLVFIDATKGWLVTDSGLQTEAPTAQYICASSPCVATVGNFKIHTFTSPGNFVVNSTGNACGSNSVDYLVIAGGGAGGSLGGGGGAGGYRFSNGTVSGSYCAGPAPLGASALPVSAQAYPITIGAGGAPITSSGASNSGTDTIFSSITSTGGGRGGTPSGPVQPGGSGGGSKGPAAVGTGNNPPVSPPQGNDGGPGPGSGGGGGGAGAVGGTGVPAPGVGGVGGAGLTSSINNSAVARGGGGGGGNDYPGSAPAGGVGGGGTGGTRPSTAKAGSGTDNTGGGGGGAGVPGSSGTGAGGSGIVIIRYKFQ